MVAIEELLRAFEPYRGLKHPPAEHIRLWCGGGCGIWISKDWGPPIPYPAADHGDGTKNYGYVRIKGNQSAVSGIPEAVGWPELESFLENINSASSPIESVGCEKGFFPTESKDTPAVMLGSYVDVIFTDIVLNDDPENHLLLAHRLTNSILDCEKWWANITFLLQRHKFVPGTNLPWGLMLHMTNYGRSEKEARDLWSQSLSRLTDALVALPEEFRYEG